MTATPDRPLAKGAYGRKRNGGRGVREAVVCGKAVELWSRKSGMV